MKHSILNRFQVFGVGLTALMLGSLVAAQDRQFDLGSNSANLKTTIVKVKTFDGLAVIPFAGGSLLRDDDGILSHISTSGLTPGNVVTLWVAIFNNPRRCAGSQCAASDLNNPNVKGSLQFGGSAIVGAGGRADFAGFLGLNDNTGFVLLPPFPHMPNPAPGLLNSNRAEIHLIIRNHGPASFDPTTLQAQLSSFGGGCTVENPCANVQAAIFAP